MDAGDFRRIALSLAGAEESSHMGSPDFRVGGRIFATLASQSQGYGNLMLTPEQQAAFVEELHLWSYRPEWGVGPSCPGSSESRDRKLFHFRWFCSGEKSRYCPS